ncbi:MAG: hypothetical protein ACJ8F7_22800 [Gemmataceae bacterium]
MTRSFRCTLAIALLLAGASGVSYAVPEWPEDLGVDFWNMPQLNRQIDQCRRQRQEIETSAAETLRRIERKGAVVRDLIDGRLTFVEAATRFRDLNANSAHYQIAIQLNYPDVPGDERHCRNVIDYVRNQHPDEPAARACAAACEEELPRLRAACGGSIRLPD